MDLNVEDTLPFTDKFEIRLWSRMIDIFPLLSSYELESLTNSIKKYGVKNPILVLNDGRIIDGNNRWLISKKLKIHCPFTRVLLSEDEAFRGDFERRYRMGMYEHIVSHSHL